MLYLIRQDFIIHQGDFKGDFFIVYKTGKLIFDKPADLYKPEHMYSYLPVFAMFLSITFSLLPFNIANYSFYIMNIFLGMLFTLEFNRILVLMDVKEKMHRFLFLMIISNGMIIFQLFFLNQFKYIIGVIILFVLKRQKFKVGIKWLNQGKFPPKLVNTLQRFC